MCFQWDTGEQGMLIRKESQLTQINSSHHLFSPGRDPAAEQGLAVWLPAFTGTTELGGGDGPSPVTPSSNLTNNTPCSRLNLRQTYGGGKMPLWQHQHQHSGQQLSPTCPRMSAGDSVPRGHGGGCVNPQSLGQKGLAAQGGW